MTILGVAQADGIDIPTLYYRPELPPIGACPIRAVEIEGSRAMVGSCQLPPWLLLGEKREGQDGSWRWRSPRWLYP